jgi:hypothetical protein
MEGAHMTRPYQKPQGQFIGEGAEKLYKLEEKRSRAIELAAKELAKVLGHHEGCYWTDTMPEVLLSILDSYDPRAARLAAEVYIEKDDAKHERLAAMSKKVGA